MIKQYDQLVKLVLVGGSGVGKSSLLTQFAENKFTEKYITTIGVDFRFKSISQDGRIVRVQVWDTAGQQRFRTMTSSYYKGADGIIMVYDITEPGSVDDLQNYWIKEAQNYCDKTTKVLLLGNKADSDRVVSSERVKKMADKYGYITEEVSAKTGDKVWESIKNFGIEVAKRKMQKNGLNWLSNYPSMTAHFGSSNSRSSESQFTRQSSLPKIGSERQGRSSSKQASKGIQKPQQTIKITNAKKNVGPSYQKKCC